MDQLKLCKVEGDILAIGPHKDFEQGKRYEFIRVRVSDTLHTTVRNIVAAAEVNRYLGAGQQRRECRATRN